MKSAFKCSSALPLGFELFVLAFRKPGLCLLILKVPQKLRAPGKKSGPETTDRKPRSFSEIIDSPTLALRAEEEFSDSIGAQKEIIGKFRRWSRYCHMLVHGHPPKLSLTAHHVIAMGFPRRQVGVAAFDENSAGSLGVIHQ